MLLGLAATPAWCDYTIVGMFGGNAGTYFNYSDLTDFAHPFGMLEFIAPSSDYTFDPNQDLLQLEITQTTPSAGSASFTGAFSGTLSLKNVYLTFTPASSTIGNVTYTPLPNPLKIDVDANGKVTDISGMVTVPESMPVLASMAAVFAPCFGYFLAGLTSRRKRAA
jgi:hypothetical protein